MNRIVLATGGSLGDLHPYLAIGIGLRARGHEVTIATAEFYRDKVVAEGLEFAALRGALSPAMATPETTRQAFDRWSGTRFLLKERILPQVEKTYRDLLEVCRGSDLLVSHPTILPASLVAEKLGIKWISGVLSPMTILSAYDPPLLPPAPWLQSLRPLGPLPHRAVHGVLRAAAGKLMEPITRLRQSEGLRPRSGSGLHDDMFSPHGTLALFSPLLARPQKDWPKSTWATGFPLYYRAIEEGTRNAELQMFLALGRAPIVFTLGSAAVVDAGDFYEQSVAAVKKLGRRAILLVGTETEPYNKLRSDEIFVTPYARYTEVFPYAAAVVHQGGIGTTAQVMHAGAPSLVVPFGLDQPDNANRLLRLGTARVLPRYRYTAERASQALHSLLEEPGWREAAWRMGEMVRREDGVSAACDAIEQVCAGS
jgi:rhamnosyltransferase subunit B